MTSRISHDAYESALARGREALDQPHVVAVRYIANARMLELTYSHGLVLRFDPKTVPVLRNLSRAVLSRVYVVPGGDGLVFGEDDRAAISIPGLLARLIPLDIARSAVAAARGRVSTPSKADAARRNGAKGGRPIKANLVPA